MGDDKRNEEHLSVVFTVNGYPDHVIGSVTKQERRRKQQQDYEPQHTICLPSVCGMSKDIRRV